MEPKLEILLRTIIVTIARKTPDPLIVNIGDCATLTVQVDGDDMGRCVGKRGATIWAIQAILWYAGLAHYGFPYKVRIIEPRVKSVRFPAPFKFKSNWDREIIHNLCGTIIHTCLPGHASFFLREHGHTSAVAQIKIMKYLERNMDDPSFSEAVSTVLRAAGMSQGVAINSEIVFA